MKRFALSSIRRLNQLGALALLLSVSSLARAGAIPFDTWLEFSFGDAGTPAAGCFPDDPAGAFCIPSGGTPTSFLDAAPWTFTAGASGATLTVVDAFVSGDRFELFDFGVSLGLTSLPGSEDVCGDDPATCLATPGMSRLIASLGAGLHSLTLTPTLSPGGGGAGYLQVKEGGGNVSVPEPSTYALFGIALLGLGLTRTRGTARTFK